MGKPLRVILSAGQIADIDFAPALIKNLPSQAVVADKGYDADHFVATIEAAGAEAVIPPRSNRLRLAIAPLNKLKCAIKCVHYLARRSPCKPSPSAI